MLAAVNPPFLTGEEDKGFITVHQWTVDRQNNRQTTTLSRLPDNLMPNRQHVISNSRGV